MSDLSSTLADFELRQAERSAQATLETEHLKHAVLAPLRDAGIVRVEVRFDGCGDSGAVEACECFDQGYMAVACPEVAIAPFDFVVAREPTGEGPMLVADALDALTYLALERFHPGWEINDGSGGMLVVEVPEASFNLECSLRYTAYDEHFTGL